MDNNLETLANVLEKAVCPEGVFGLDLDHNYKYLVKICHPDLHQTNKDKATLVFNLLQVWKERADSKVALGVYGNYLPYVQPKVEVPYIETTFDIKPYTVTLTKLLGEGAVSSVHRAKIKQDPTKQYFVKIANHPRDNDLLEREFSNLSQIYAKSSNPQQEAFFKIQRVYTPEPIKSFSISGKDGTKRKANLFATTLGNCYTIEELLKMDKFEKGLPRKHSFWIFRRLLLTLLLAHSKNLVHGAVTPNHVLVFPKEHGLVLLDWTASSVRGKEHIPLVNKNYKDFYPKDVFSKKFASRSTDNYMASKLFLHMTESPLDSTIVSCMDKHKDSSDALKFYDELEVVIEKVDGPRKFVEMEI